MPELPPLSEINLYGERNSAPACARCDKLMWDSFPGNQPVPSTSGGTNFTSRGNYGSTVWDPTATTDRRSLLVVICDECLTLLRDSRQVLVITPPPPDTRLPQVEPWKEEYE
jgi:hypothetical protein